MQQKLLTLSIYQKNGHTVVVYHPGTLEHKSSRKHPECPERVQETLKFLRQRRVEKTDILSQSQLPELKDEDVQQIIREAHGQNYLEFVMGMWHEGIKKPQMYINIDTYFTKHTYPSALAAAKTIVQISDSLHKGDFMYAFALVRPPGHHSGMKTQPHGFSFFNNIGLSAKRLLSHGVKKIAILDWDAHHGQGTQKLFYESREVLNISMHRFDNGKFFPHIPQSGSSYVGAKDGLFHNLNVCWNLQQKPKGYVYEQQETVGDQEYAKCFSKIVMPVLSKYDPQYILVSCGFDSATGDPIANLRLTRDGYAYMTAKLMEFKKPILLALQGGYNLEVLKWASEAVLQTLAGKASPIITETNCNEIGQNGINAALDSFGSYWKLK